MNIMESLASLTIKGWFYNLLLSEIVVYVYPFHASIKKGLREKEIFKMDLTVTFKQE